MKMTIYIYGALLFVSILLIYSATKQYNETKKIIEKGIKTKATVIDFITVTSRDGNHTFKPVFEYTDRLNTKIVFESEIGSYPKSYTIGDKVNIIHSRNNKEQKVVSFWGLYRGAIILLCLASPLLIIGGSYILYTYL